MPITGKPVPITAEHIGVSDPSGNLTALKTDNTGALKVSVSGAGSGGTSSNFGDAFPVAGSAAGFKSSDGLSMQPANLDVSGNLKVAGTLTTTPPASGTSALTNVAESAVSVTLLAANSARLAFEVFNDSDGVLLVKAGAVASATSFSWRVQPRDRLTSEAIGVNYTGRLDGLWETTPGTVGHASARVTELTA